MQADNEMPEAIAQAAYFLTQDAELADERGTDATVTASNLWTVLHALDKAQREREEAMRVVGELTFQGKADGLVLLHATAKDPFWQQVAKFELGRRASTPTAESKP